MNEADWLFSCPDGPRFSWTGYLEQGTASGIGYHHLCKHACKDNNRDVMNAP